MYQRIFVLFVNFFQGSKLFSPLHTLFLAKRLVCGVFMTSLTQKLLGGLVCHVEQTPPPPPHAGDGAEAESGPGSYWHAHFQKFWLKRFFVVSVRYVQFEYRTRKILDALSWSLRLPHSIYRFSLSGVLCKKNQNQVFGSLGGRSGIVKRLWCLPLSSSWVLNMLQSWIFPCSESYCTFDIDTTLCIPFHFVRIWLECPPLFCFSGRGRTAIVTAGGFSKSGLCNKNNSMSGTEINTTCCSVVCCFKAKKDKNK